MKVIIGLGNPGKNYEKTRHNAGFILLDQIAKDIKFVWQRKKSLSSFVSKGYFASENILLIKPDDFMNLNGYCVKKVVDYYDLKISDLLFIHDDLDMDFGNVKIKMSGGHGGHNGIRDTILNLGSSDFKRIKIGIGRPKENISITEWVLTNFSKKEMRFLKEEIFLQVKDKMILVLNLKI